MSAILTVITFCFLVVSLQADSVFMQNGDHYNGKVLSMTTSNLVFQSDVLGRLTLSRAKVAGVHMGTNTVAKFSPLTSTNQPAGKSANDISATLRQLSAHTNLIGKVQSQFLADASPEANARFNQIVSDLSSGKMTMADLRAQAKDVANQLRELQRESGEDADGTADLYLSILDNFLEATAKDGTNSPRR